MHSLIDSQARGIRVAALLGASLMLGSAGSVIAGQASVAAGVDVAGSGRMDPAGTSVAVDVTATCPAGWSWAYGRLYVLQGDRGGAGLFSAACTGSPQVVHVTVTAGNGRFALGSWTANAYVGIRKSGRQVTVTDTATIRLEPGVIARVADQGQVTGTSGGGVRIAISVACPTGATGQPSSVTVSQGSAGGGASFTPTCDGQTRALLLSITASQGTFHAGSAVANASVTVTADGKAFSGVDSRSVTLLESSTGDATPPSSPGGLSANTFQDGETWLSWVASTDNATPTAQLSYEVSLNGHVDQTVGGGLTQAILYAEVGALNTIEVVAVDGAGNRSEPATAIVDMR
jgi:hypothetical protein